MALTTLPTIKLSQLSSSLEKLRGTFNEAEIKKGFTDKAAAAMLKSVDDNFASGSDPDGKPWMSNASDTRAGGRFSAKYNRSGNSRLVDTGRLRASYRVLRLSPTSIVIGPSGERNRTIAKAALSWGNVIVGAGKKQLKALNDLMVKYLHNKATGRV